MLNKLALLIALVFSSIFVWAGSAPDPIINQAKVLYNQRKPATLQLREAAGLGDPEAQFYLAEELRRPFFAMTQEASMWYEKSAAQGNLYSMYRLAFSNNGTCKALQTCPKGSKSASEWNTLLLQTAENRAAQGDSEAMSIMYLATKELKWLEKAADAGDPESQWLLANRYREGQGVFFIPSNRKKEEERLLKLAAANGLAIAQTEYAGLLADRGEHAVGEAWYLAAVTQSDIYALSGYAYMLEKGGFYTIPKDPIKAYAFYSLIAELNTTGALRDETRESMNRLEKLLSPSDLEKARSYAADWADNHPPLSFHRMRLGM